MHIKTIGKIRHLLPQKTTEQLTHAFVTSRIDSCNSLRYGLPAALIHKLQRLQNTAARLVTRTRKYCHISPVLRELHWLPVEQRVVFKILLLTYRALHGMAPVYLQDLLVPYTPTRTVRSSSDGLLLSVPRTKCQRFGDRAFSVAAPRLWNNLPHNIRNTPTLNAFKTRLKSYLFCL